MTSAAMNGVGRNVENGSTDLPTAHDHGVLPWSHGSKVSADLRRARLLEVRDRFQGLVLDLGCGARPYQPLLGRNSRRWVGLDMPTPYSGPSSADAFGSALQIPFQSDRFDVVLCTEVLEHVTLPQALFDEAFRVIRPGGLLVLTVPQTCHLHEEPHDYWRFTKHGLRFCAERSGFQVAELEPMGGAVATVGQMIVWHLNWIRRFPLGSIASRAINSALAWTVLALDRQLTARYGGGGNATTLEWILVARKLAEPGAPSGAPRSA